MTSNDLDRKCAALAATWHSYQVQPQFEQFVEFAVTLSSFAEFLNGRGISGLHQRAHELEQQALAAFGDQDTHPVPPQLMQELGDRLGHLVARVGAYVESEPEPLEDRRMGTDVAQAISLLQSRRVWFVGGATQGWQALIGQLGYFGIAAETYNWHELPPPPAEPGVLLLDTRQQPAEQLTSSIAVLRARFEAATLIAVDVAPAFRNLQQLLAAGCDQCLVAGTPAANLLGRIIELSGSEDEDTYRVLVVEDSITASKLIQRTLRENGIDSEAIINPAEVLGALQRYQPDLILMDMYMPDCTGVEAARVVRQHPEFLSIPIIYLSGETDVALQIDALRLGGDQFLTKPFNPVILNAVVKSKIERYRLLRRSMFHDSLTGLLNHTSSKQRLDAAVAMASAAETPLAVAMIDIDHFKQVNDRYGHPIGDQIIRSLAWLLKQRLRNSDVIGRYGGEEFLVGLPGATTEQAFDVLDRIRRDFAQIRHAFGDSTFTSSFSAGVAGFPNLNTGEALVKDADVALYEAKRGGRNRVVAHG
ncbi:diguanylate cyclase [Chitinimonas sp. BJYL2]|uniref:GGDEF domain-containing response regulator n=1 Tax=Chitinimonas sp. BJYL2 TaxID=2976696 RepID=UPI0022B346B9|nr:diguanylate cyclase [Chitinimonas sp. BJYL2]